MTIPDPEGARSAETLRRFPRVPEGFTQMTFPVTGAAHLMPGYVRLLCCDDCGSLVGNTAAHRVLCNREDLP